MASLLSLLSVISLPVIILVLAAIDFLVMHATRQPATAYALSILGFIYAYGGASMYFSGDPVFAMPGVVVLLFGIMQLVWGLWTIRQYRKNPKWGNF